MNVFDVDVVKKLEQHNEYLKFIAFLRECAKFYIEAHHYIHDHIYMLDYPPESMFDDFILQEENECLLERTEYEKLEIEAIDAIKLKIEEAFKIYKQEMEKHQKEIRKCQEEMEKCQEEMEKCQEEMEKCQEEMKKCQEEMEKCQEEIKKYQQEIKKYQQEIKKYQQEIDYKKKNPPRPPIAFIGGYDITNGYVSANYAQDPPKVIHKQLKDLVDKKVKEKKLSPIGFKGIYSTNIVGRCAEFHVVNEILLHNKKFFGDSKENNIDNIRLTFALRITANKQRFENRIKKESTGMNVLIHWLATLIKTGSKFLPYCPNCKFMFEGKPTLKESFI